MFIDSLPPLFPMAFYLLVYGNPSMAKDFTDHAFVRPERRNRPERSSLIVLRVVSIFSPSLFLELIRLFCHRLEHLSLHLPQCRK